MSGLETKCDHSFQLVKYQIQKMWIFINKFNSPHSILRLPIEIYLSSGHKAQFARTVSHSLLNRSFVSLSFVVIILIKHPLVNSHYENYQTTESAREHVACPNNRTGPQRGKEESER